VVWNDLVFLTTAIEGELVPGRKAPCHFRKGRSLGSPRQRGRRSRAPLEVIAIDADRGDRAWSRTAYEGLVYDNRHQESSYASPTCVTDGKTLIAYFGAEGCSPTTSPARSCGTATSATIKSFGLGVASSPILVGDRVIVQADEDQGTTPT
jgi:hypothetical protein